MSLFWLASYPKSGNTWMRALLTNFLRLAADPASINALLPSAPVSDRHEFDERIGISSSELTSDEIQSYRPLFHELLAAEAPRPSFAKVHDACVRTADGELLFPASATDGAIYIARNPLDVAVSFAHYSQRPIDSIVACMNDPSFVLASHVSGMSIQLPQPLLTWSGHVSSWLDQGAFPVHCVRYENLLDDPLREFGAVVRFADLDYDADRIAQAVKHSRFDLLRDQEARDGFRERAPWAPSFFREGRAGSWRNALSARQVRAVVDAHAPAMERLGYLCEAEEFLAARSSAPPQP